MAGAGEMAAEATGRTMWELWTAVDDRGRLKRGPLAGPKNERSGPEKGRRAARPDSVLWRRESGQAGLLTRAFSRQRSASLRSLRAAADAPIVSRPEE
jgi:hypothetical protein